jgi:adenylate kinase
MKKDIVILMGVPASGKGTQARRIAQQFGYAHISTGELLRALEEDPDANASDLKQLEEMKAGGIVEKELIFKLVFSAIQKSIKAGHGVVLDGAIRTLEQAKGYKAFFDEHNLDNRLIVIEVAISDEESLDRLSRRLAYAKKGEVVPALRNFTSGVFVEKERKDDDPEIVKNRLKEQGNDALAPILAYYRDLGILVSVDGMKEIDVVEEQIQKILKI